MNCRNNTLSAREVARFLCKRVIANEGFDDIEIEGKLVCVGRDFIAIKTDNKEVFYLPLCNVRNIAVVSDDKNCCDKDRRKICSDTFRSILRKLINCQVRVNDGGDEEIEGVLTSVSRRFIQIVEEETLNIVTIPIGSINFIVQSGEHGNCGILCCKKEDPCGKKKDKDRKKHDCKKESSSKFCKKESSSSSSSFCCNKESSSSSSTWHNESSSSDHFCCKKKNKNHKKRCCEDLDSRGWFRL